LDHSNIVQCLSCFEDDDFGYNVMEFCGNGDLLSYFDENNRSFSHDFLKQILFQSASALEYINQHGLSHNDIKPNNIFLTGKNVVKIGDF
jgi:serine/threonine protein kinase